MKSVPLGGAYRQGTSHAAQPCPDLRSWTGLQAHAVWIRLPSMPEAKVALVTGAGRGIGRDIALSLAREGYACGLIARTKSQLDETAELIRKAGGKALVTPTDVAKREQVLASVEAVERELGPISVLINNAAYAILRMELARTAAGQPGERAMKMLDLSGPTPDFTQISTGLGVPATRVTTAAELDKALRQAYAEPGPHLIEAIVPPLVPPPSATAW